MIKSYVITITEVDDTEFALEELETQLSKIELMKNTIGIVSVSTDYFETGVYAAVAKALPFPLIGMSAYAQNANGNIGIYLFSILVLTSDDCEFAHGISDEIPEQGDVTALTRELYKKINPGLEKRAKLALMYAPFFMQYCNYNYIKAIVEFDEALPVFGSLANCEVMKMETDTRTVYNENIYTNRVVMLLISGNISPQFYIGSITKESIILPNIGEVTASKDNVVMEINNIKVNDVLEKIGFKDGALKDEGSMALTFLMNEKDSDGNIISSATRGISDMLDGAAVFGGRVPVGASLSGAICTKDVIMQTAEETLSKIKEDQANKTVLFYSCLGRQMTLLDEPMKEYELISDKLKDSGFTFVAAAAGGEICPTSVTENKAHNSEHDQTLIACVF